MSKARAQELIDLGNKLYTDKAPLDRLCQEVAENVYPERADFTRQRYLGENFADHLMDSFPLLARRELGNSLSATLRPRDRAWFRTTTLDDARDNAPDNAQFLEYMTNRIKSSIYHPKSNFIAATKSGDHDFVSFGNAIISVEEGPNRDHLFFRLHHFRDCAWLENEIGIIDHLHRKDQMTPRQMKRKFGENKLADPVKLACEKSPNQMFNIRCIVMPADEYDYLGGDSKNAKGRKHPFVIVYIDVDNVKVMKEGGLHDFMYAVPRWHRIAGVPYAFSPAALTSLPDARMAQMLASIILEAGEKMVEPPIAALEEVVREASLQAGSITWVDSEYEGPVRDAIAPMKFEGDMRVGFEMRKDVRDMLSRAWFLDKLALPEAGKQMTAYETARRIEEHVRNLLPLFEPMEVEYNTQLLDKAFSVMNNMKMFDWSNAPQALSGSDFTWAFQNPMQEASSRILVSQFGEVGQLLKAAQEFGVTLSPIKMGIALGDAIRGTSAPSSWRKSEEEKEAERAALADAQAKMQAQAAMAGAAQELSTGAQVAQQVGDAALSLRESGLLPPRTPDPTPSASPLATLDPQQLDQQAA